MIKKAFKNLILLLLCLLLALPCAAAEGGSIAAYLKDSAGAPVSGLSLSLCQIATLKEGALAFGDGFEEAGFSLDILLGALNETNANTILEYIQKNQLPKNTLKSQEGALTFSGLTPGLYLLFCEEEQSLYFAPFFITLPFDKDGAPCYHATATPKLSENNESSKSIYLIKKWEDRDNKSGKRPKEITAELLRDGAPIATATLSAETGWAYTFKDLPKSGRYSIKEYAVEGYRAECNGDAENGFILTNTLIEGKLPQTGQYWWPILILAVAGIGLISLGFLERGRKKHEKKSK